MLAEELKNNYSDSILYNTFYFYTIYNDGQVVSEGTCLVNDVLFSDRLNSIIYHCYDVKHECYFFATQENISFVLAVY